MMSFQRSLSPSGIGERESRTKIIIIFFSAAILFFASAVSVFAIDDTPLPANDKSQENTCDLSKLPEPVTEKSAFLPDCVYFESASLDLQKKCGCRNVNVFVDFLVKYANGMFLFVGGGALLFFVYGGFVILTAAGGERVKKGRDIIVAAVIGLIIIFTEQVGLKFILAALLKKAPGEPTNTNQTPATLEGLQIKVKEIAPTQ